MDKNFFSNIPHKKYSRHLLHCDWLVLKPFQIEFGLKKWLQF